MTKTYECDCGASYSHPDQINHCAQNNHFQPNRDVVQEITESLINENTKQFPYEERRDLGWQTMFVKQPGSCAISWVGLACKYVRYYKREFPGIEVSVPEIIAIGSKLCEYYIDHAKEMNTPQPKETST